MKHCSVYRIYNIINIHTNMYTSEHYCIISGSKVRITLLEDMQFTESTVCEEHG